jgi:hypothetical protein
MATCSANDLIADGKCFLALPEQLQRAIALRLWCLIADAAPPGEEE